MSEPEPRSQFNEYIARGLDIALARLQAGHPLMPDTLSRAFQLLPYALSVKAMWPRTRELLLALAPRLEWTTRRTDWMALLALAIRCSERYGDESAAAAFRYFLGLHCYYQGQYEAARALLEASNAGCVRLGDALGQARALNRLAQVARQQGRFAEARRLLDQASPLTGGDEPEQAYNALARGTLAHDRQMWGTARAHNEWALTAWRRLGDPRMIAWALNNLGAVFQRLGQYEEAARRYEAAIEQFGGLDDPVNEAVARMNLGTVHLLQGRPAEALGWYWQALVTLQARDGPLHEAWLHLNRALAYQALERWEQAERAFRVSIERWEQVGQARGIINAQIGLIELYLELGERGKARPLLQAARARLPQVPPEGGRAHLAAALDALAQLLETKSDEP